MMKKANNIAQQKQSKARQNKTFAFNFIARYNHGNKMRLLRESTEPLRGANVRWR